jgi:ribonuclease BN (tRNA processing enzyme)
MDVQFLGSGDAFGSGGRFQTCILVSASGGRLLVDCGASSLIAMKRAGVDPGEIDGAVLSHLHGDHFGGIPFLVLDGQFNRRLRPLVVAGPPGVEARVQAATEVFFPGATGVTRRFAVQFVEIAARIPTAVGPATVTAFPVAHESGAPSYALRLAWDGKVLVYSGDTEWTETLIEAAHGADLFVCEAYSFEKSIRLHMSYTALRAARSRLDCAHVILTHMSGDMLSRLDEVELETASDGTVIVV